MCTKKNTLYIKTITSLFQVTGKAPVRAYHSCTVVNEELLIFGGVFPNPDPIPDGCSNDVHFFSTGRCLPCLTLLRIFFVTCVWRNTLLSPQFFVSGWSPVIGFYPCLIENHTTFIFPDIFLSGGNVAKYWGGGGPETLPNIEGGGDAIVSVRKHCLLFVSIIFKQKNWGRSHPLAL